jgi:hypothetical protein
LSKKQQKITEKRLQNDDLNVKNIFKWYKWAKVPKYQILQYKYKDGYIMLCLNRPVTKEDENHFIEIIESGDDIR